jgi:hypothetical protein
MLKRNIKGRSWAGNDMGEHQIMEVAERSRKKTELPNVTTGEHPQSKTLNRNAPHPKLFEHQYDGTSGKLHLLNFCFLYKVITKYCMQLPSGCVYKVYMKRISNLDLGLLHKMSHHKYKYSIMQNLKI